MMSKNRWHCVFVETPVGEMTGVFQKNPFLLAKILLPGKKINTPVDSFHRDPAVFKQGVDEIREISRLLNDALSGKAFQVPWDYMGMDGFTVLQRAVYQKAVQIPYGSLSTYKKIAEDIGRPGAYRFVGTTLAKNLFPILIPCHRVIRSDNNIGGFGGGSALKQSLISHEAGGGLL